MSTGFWYSIRELSELVKHAMNLTYLMVTLLLAEDLTVWH